MDFEEFKEYIISNIAEYLPEEYQEADILISRQIKNNDTVLDGLRIVKDTMPIVPVLYINDMYQEYREGMEIDHVVSGLADAYTKVVSERGNLDLDMPLENIEEYEKIKDKITCRLVNRAANEKRLQGKPFTPVEDLAVSYHIQMVTEEDGIGSIAITEEMMEMYGIDLSTLHEQALTNMERFSPAIIKPLDEILVENMVSEFMREYGMSVEEAKRSVEAAIPESIPGLLCVTNDRGLNGAVCIVSPEVQQKLAETAGGDYYVLPSSVHEILVLPKTGKIKGAELEEVVQSVNREEVSIEERLSDHIYEYNAKEHVFRIYESMQQNESLKIEQENPVQKYNAKLH